MTEKPNWQRSQRSAESPPSPDSVGLPRLRGMPLIECPERRHSNPKPCAKKAPWRWIPDARPVANYAAFCHPARRCFSVPRPGIRDPQVVAKDEHFRRVCRIEGCREGIRCVSRSPAIICRHFPEVFGIYNWFMNNLRGIATGTEDGVGRPPAGRFRPSQTQVFGGHRDQTRGRGGHCMAIGELQIPRRGGGCIRTMSLGIRRRPGSIRGILRWCMRIRNRIPFGIQYGTGMLSQKR